MFQLRPSLAALLLTTAAAGQPLLLDDFESPDAWTVIASDGVRAAVRPVEGLAGRGLRLEFEFQSGAGFCVLRRQLELRLPANYRFSFALRGSAPPNNLELKLVAPDGANVWWVNRRHFEPPGTWQTLTQRARHFRFAWGPDPDRRLEAIGALEFAVAASAGGAGHIDFDELTFEPLPEPRPPAQAPSLHCSSTAGPAPAAALAADGHLDWRSDPADEHPWLTLDFHQVRELGGLALDWDPDDFATAYEVQLSDDGQRWESAATVADSTGGRDYVPLPDAHAARLRLRIQRTSRGRGVGLAALRVLDVGFADTPNAMFAAIARESPPGRLPRYFHGQQPYWTVVGAAGDDREALLDTDGALEVDKRGFRLEPFLLLSDRLLTWADVETRPALADGCLPIPSVIWQTPAAELEITALADGPAGRSRLLARYRVANLGSGPLSGALLVAVRPFQVLPPWQELNITGGVARVEQIACAGRGLVEVNGRPAVQCWTPPDGCGATTFAQGDVVEHLAAGRLPPQRRAADPAGLAAAALRFDFSLPPGGERTVVLAAPLHEPRPDALPDPPVGSAAEEFARAAARVRDFWRQQVSRVELALPPEAAALVATFQATQAYILINADGPAIQPGSRTYERSWIRDGALTSTALLCTGHADAVRAFLDWYAPYQFDSGKVPCVVDRRGPDPVPEHDSTGELIYALRTYYEFTRDRALLERHLPRIVAGIGYLEALRGQRLTAEYRDGPPERRACYGLVPESISHEGYSARPMHSYWDSFFVLRGLKDAAACARVLERPELARRCAALRDEYRTALSDSLRLAIRHHGIDYIPGCVELGDFDAASTAIGVFPGGELGLLPEPELHNTFARYLDFFRERAAGRREWDNYTPYEIRLAGTFVRLGQPDHAHELLDFFLRDQRPPAWRHWAEVVWRDPATPRFIGDMPHTWVGSEFINAVRSLFVYEREQDEALVLAAGLRPEWLDAPGGLAVRNFPTAYGRLSYTLRRAGRPVLLELDGQLEIPPGGLVIPSPLRGPIRSVEIDGRPVETFDAQEARLRVPKGCIVIDCEPAPASGRSQGTTGAGCGRAADRPPRPRIVRSCPQ